MMVSRPEEMEEGDEEMYTDSELGEEEEYSEEIIEEVETERSFVPKTFEDFKSVYQAQYGTHELEVSPPEPQSVDVEMEKRVEQELLRTPPKPVAQESSEIETDEPFSQEEEYEPEEDDLEEPEEEEPEEDELDEPEEYSGELPRILPCWSIKTNNLSLIDEELVDEEEVEYEEDEELEDSEELSDLDDVDDTDLMKRLEAKYGKISGDNSDDEDQDGSWTSNYELTTNHILIIWFRFTSPGTFFSVNCILIATFNVLQKSLKTKAELRAIWRSSCTREKI